MNATFMNSENSKTSEPYRLLLNLSDKVNLKSSDKYVALSNLSISYTWKNIKSHPKAIGLKYGSYSVSDIQDHFENIIKKHQTVAGNPPIRIYVN